MQTAETTQRAAAKTPARAYPACKPTKAGPAAAARQDPYAEKAAGAAAAGVAAEGATAAAATAAVEAAMQLFYLIAALSLFAMRSRKKERSGTKSSKDGTDRLSSVSFATIATEEENKLHNQTKE